MDIGSPLRSLLPPTAAGCLTVLAVPDASSGLSGREVARRVEASSAALARSALLGLVQVGLVIREAGRREVRYRVNREHLLWPAIQVALGSRELFQQRVIDFVAASRIPDTAVLLYGSTVRGQAQAGSDLDLLVVFPDDVGLADRDAFSGELSTAVTAWTGQPAQIYDLTVSDLDEHVAADAPIVASWRAEAQLLAGAQPGALTRTAA